MVERGESKKVSVHKKRNRKELVNMKDIKINVDSDKEKIDIQCPYTIIFDSLHLQRHLTGRRGLIVSL